MARCECAGCGERFSGVEAFDLHQSPAGTCHPPGSMRLARDEHGIWQRWRSDRQDNPHWRVQAQDAPSGDRGENLPASQDVPV